MKKFNNKIIIIFKMKKIIKIKIIVKITNNNKIYKDNKQKMIVIFKITKIKIKMKKKLKKKKEFKLYKMCSEQTNQMLTYSENIQI